MILDNHAYLIEGNIDLNFKRIEDYLREQGFHTKSNPNFSIIKRENFGIDDARYLKIAATRKAVGDSKKIYMISLNFITSEAQNALLKIFEEPNPDTQLFILAPSSSIFLPTLISRLSVIYFPDNLSKDTLTVAHEFLSSSIEDRLRVLKSIVDHDNETKKSELLNFMNAVEVNLQKEMRKDNDSKIAEIIHELLILKSFVSGRAPSVKMIGEYLAVKLPSIKT